MLSDEEKKAIEDLKEVIDLYNDGCLITTDDDIKSIDIVLNLIEKQSKEIEELKNEYLSSWVNQKYISKDKIKAKIEEYKKQIEKMEKDDVGIGFTLGKEWSDLKAKIEFGQSLLEKEE